MAVKKKTVKKAPVKKVESKTDLKPTAAADKSDKKSLNIITWLLKPDLSQSRNKWLGRTVILTFSFFALIFAISARMMQTEFVAMGFMNLGFTDALSMVFYSVLENPANLIVALIMVFILGGFALMPRRPVNKDDFAALLVSYTVLALLGAGLSAAIIYTPIQSNLLTLFTAFVLYAAVTALFSAVVSWARNHSVPKPALLLSFPLGYAWYEWSGLFLPEKKKNGAIQIRMAWYKKFINFLLYNIRGQILIAAFVLAGFIFIPSYWEAAMILSFAGLFFIHGKAFMADNMTKLSIIPIVINVIALSYIGYTVSQISLSTLMAMAG